MQRNLASAFMTTISDRVADESAAGSMPHRSMFSRAYFWWAVFLIMALAVAMRLGGVFSPIERDFDEGVYWQTLRAMSAGHALYKDIFYSQPPFFALMTFESYQLGGQTLAGARAGVAAASLLGIAGAGLLGFSLQGRGAALAAMALVAANPIYLSLSPSLQADGVSTAFSLLSVALAFAWLRRPEGWFGYLCAGAAGATLALSLLTKLLCIATCLPIALIVLGSLWERREVLRTEPFKVLAPPAVMLACFVLTLGVMILPFASIRHETIAQVITYHQDAGRFFTVRHDANHHKIEGVLSSLLFCLALAGGAIAIRARDWRVYPLIVWLAGTIALLLHISPLLSHHLVARIAPLAALAAMAFPKSGAGGFWSQTARAGWKTPSIAGSAVLLLCATLAVNVQKDIGAHNWWPSKQPAAIHDIEGDVVKDIRLALQPRELLVTDAPFIAALADRSTPATLVDPSTVRIKTGYLTLRQLEDATSQGNVHGVLFFTGRFQLEELAGFHEWVAANFRLQRDYGSDRQLWVR